jgi:glycosyltransferase involved in cell wall biosynthesis
MRVLFVGHPSTKPTDGGSTTFLNALSDELVRSPEWLYLAPAHNSRGAVARDAALMEVDLVWFLSPYFEPPPAGVPYVCTVWDLGHRELPLFPEVSTAPGATWTFAARERYYREVLPGAARVIVGTEAGLAQVARCYGVAPASIDIIPLCIDVEALRAGPPGNADLAGLKAGEYVLYPAQFWPHKNHVTLIDMLRILRGRGHPFKLVCPGADKGNQTHVQQYAVTQGLEDCVLFPGFVSVDTLHQLYLDAFALVYGSLMGPDNLPPLEAMALDCPVVCAGYAGAEEQLGEAALYFEPLDAKDAANQVEYLVREPATRAAKIRRGRLLVEESTPAHYIAEIRQVVSELENYRRLWGRGYRHL